MSDTRGPSYYDVSDYAHYLRGKYGIGITFTVCPPIPSGVDNRWSSWCCSVEVRDPKTGERKGPAMASHWGKNGAWATAPAAFHDALRRLETWLEERERAARERAAF